MDISQAHCPECGKEMRIERTRCAECDIFLEGDFDVSPLAKLALEDQVFVAAFLRYHGSIKKMENLFGISYPTVKNRINAIVEVLDRSFEAPSTNLQILEKLSRGEISFAEALERIE